MGGVRLIWGGKMRRAIGFCRSLVHLNIPRFLDVAALGVFQEKHPGLPFGQWAAHSQGMVQIHTWDAFELEGLGANLQHYNFMPSFEKAVKEQWKLPESWDMHAQLVFGKPTGQPREKEFDQVEGKRLLVFGDAE